MSNNKQMTSMSLICFPFSGNTDSTRLQMSAKYAFQSLSGMNCEIPRVISNEYYDLTQNSDLGIKIAKYDGKVLFNDYEILIVYYKQKDKIEYFNIPKYKEAADTFGSQLKWAIPKNSEFKKGDVLYTYDCFNRHGIPTFGYNVNTFFIPFLGYNHEDGCIISEEFSERAIHYNTEIKIIPIYSYTIFQKLYENDCPFFPTVGERIKDDVICSIIKPKDFKNLKSKTDIKYKTERLLNKFSMSDLLYIINKNKNIDDRDVPFVTEEIKSKIYNGVVSGIKIHKIHENDNEEMLDKKLEKILNNIYSIYETHIINFYKESTNSLLSDQIPTEILEKYFIYNMNELSKNKDNYKKCKYLIEIEISKENKLNIGDKISNIYANKGVVSLIIPKELTPYTKSGKKIELILNPFGVFSRMNLGQILNGAISKTVEYYNEKIIKNPNDIKKYLNNLNENIIYRLGNKDYYNEIKTIINNIDKYKNDFINDIKENGLFIEGSAFNEINAKELLQKCANVNDDIVLPRKFLIYMKDKLKINIPYPLNDVVLKNKYCAPMYIMKLGKLSEKQLNTRDIGPVKAITNSPTRGRAKQGGSRLGQMEVEAYIANGVDRAIKEEITLKSDVPMEEKFEMLTKIISDGYYEMNDDVKTESGTKHVLNKILEFLRD